VQVKEQAQILSKRKFLSEERGQKPLSKERSSNRIRKEKGKEKPYKSNEENPASA